MKPAGGSVRRTGGSGCSIIATAPSLSPTNIAPRRWWRPSWAVGARIIGFRTAMAARWVGPSASIRSVSRIIYEADLNRRLDRLMSLIPTHKAGGKLQKIIKKVRRHLFVFVTNRDLTATNNGSERALRPCAVYRKITNRFRSQWGAALYADIRSVVETAKIDPSHR